MKDNYTHICLVVDRSGSMHGIHTDMNGAIGQLMEDQSKQAYNVTVDVITFDDQIDVVQEDVDPLDVPVNVIEPRGSTALNDAVGFAITRLGNKFRLMQEEDRPDNVIVVVVTDGMENASREYSAAQIKAMVTEQTDKWDWTFMYLAANVDAFATGSVLGFSAGQTMNFAPSAAGVGNSYAAASANVTRLSKGDRSGYTEDEREAAMEE